jgi:Flp pilus assembly CpaE family ATPase
MLRGAIIAPNADLAELLAARLKEVSGVDVVRRLDHYPDETELPRILRGSAPQVVFLSVENMPLAARVATAIETFVPGTQVIAIHRQVDSQLLLEVMRVGIREFLAAPFDRQHVYDALRRAAEALDKLPPVETSDRLYAFLPSKQGVGATTLAVNFAGALARRPDYNALLAYFDLNSGLVGFMLKLERGYSMVDAAENFSRMDETLWPQMVSSLGRLDVLQAGHMNPSYRIEPSQVRRVLDYARRNYKAICADLSGNMERYSVEVLHEATRIFLVCTPEIPSLHLAREKLNFLRGLELDSSVEVLVNRAQKRGSIPLPEIERLLGRKVLVAFPNDYKGVHRALTMGTFVQQNSELGKAFDALVKAVLDGGTQKVAAPRPFVEYFSLLPARHLMHQEGK